MSEINRLAEVFKEKKVSNRTIADFIGFQEETISRWVNNHQQPSVTTFAQIAEYLRVDIRELFHPSDWSDSEVEPYKPTTKK